MNTEEMPHFLETLAWIADNEKVTLKQLLDEFAATAPKHWHPWSRVSIGFQIGYAIEFKFGEPV